MMAANLVDNFNGKKDEDGNLPRLVRKAYCGQMTRGARKRMIESIELFSSVIKDRWVYNKYVGKRVRHRFAFVTLTIPENDFRISGKDGYDNLLEPFLFWLVKTKKVNTYIWKAELQEPLDFTGNMKISMGQLHYHLVIPNWIDKYEIREKWNYLLEINNLLSGHADPSTTSIEKPFKGKYVADYIIKEISKNCQSTKRARQLESDLNDLEGLNGREGCKLIISMELNYLNRLQELANSSIGGKVWGCSNNLKPKSVLREGVYFEEKEKCKLKIKEYQKEKRALEKCLDLFEKKQSFQFPDLGRIRFLESELFFLRKKYSSFFVKQKNFFEISMTFDMERRIDKLYNIYECRGDWEKQKNIYQNDYVKIFNLPMYYKDIYLDKQYVAEGVCYNYKEDYKQFLVKRVGLVATEKTKESEFERQREIDWQLRNGKKKKEPEKPVNLPKKKEFSQGILDL